MGLEPKELLKRPTTIGASNDETDERLAELILYVARKCADAPRFGATKLNKILYYSDSLAYVYLGKPITGAEYVARKYGPAPRRLLPVRGSLVNSGALAILEVPTRKGPQHRAIAFREPNLTYFGEHELQIVDAVIQALYEDDAESISDLSHGIAWASTPQGESIPYEMAFVSDEPLTEEEKSWGMETAERQGIHAVAD